jgi:hypothetical protein
MSHLTTIRRADTPAALIAATTGFTSDAMYVNALGIVADDGTGNVGLRKWNGTSWIVAALASASIAALAGDVTGSPGANTAVALTGTAGVVAVHGHTLLSDAGLSVNPVSKAGTGYSTTIAAGQSSDAQGGTLGLYGGPGVTAGIVEIKASEASNGLQISSSSVVCNVAPVTFTNAGTNLFEIQAARIHCYVDEFRFDEATAGAALIHIQQRTTDAVAVKLRIRSQAPNGLAVNNVTSGDISYEIPSSIGDPPNPGKHVFLVAEVDRVSIGKTGAGGVYALTLLNDTAISFNSASTSTLEIRPRDIADVGHSVRIEGGTATADNGDGGAVVLFPGTPHGTGLPGHVVLTNINGQGMVTVMSKDATHHAVVLCASGAAANLPSNMTNFVFFGESAGLPTTSPIGGFVLASIGGTPFWKMSSGAEFGIDGAVRAPAVGVLLGYVDAGIMISGTYTPICIPFHARTP